MEMEQLHFVGKSFNGQTLSTGTKEYVIHARRLKGKWMTNRTYQISFSDTKRRSYLW